MSIKEDKYSLGNPGGRPPTFEKPEDLEKKCIGYLEHCIKQTEKPTITGMTLFVGFCSRASWDDYLKRDGFSYIIKRAKMTVENSYEQSGGTFDIFALKNMGWVDKSEVAQTVQNLAPLSQDEIEAAKKRIDEEY